MAFSVLCGLAFATVSQAADGPEELVQFDRQLRKQSSTYAKMAESVAKTFSYRLGFTDDFALGNVDEDRDGLRVELNPKVPPRRRATILVWEMANAYQREKFNEITRRARSGEIKTHREYGIRMEIVEYGSHRLHREVLAELQAAGTTVDGDYLFFVNPKLKSLAEYRIPYAHDYLEAQARGGHTRHYERWFYRQTGQPSPFEAPQDDAGRDGKG